jgi:hypothetical protein
MPLHLAVRNRSLHVFAIALFATLCSRAPSNAAVLLTRPVGPDVGGYVYACSNLDDYCNVYSAHTGNILRETVRGLNAPYGMAVDNPGNWYVANASAQEVRVYKGGHTHVISTLTDPGQYPGDVATSRTDIAVANLDGLDSTPGSVSVYRYGKKNPSENLTYPTVVNGVSVAFDFYGNCFFSFTLAGNAGGDIVEFPRCSRNRTPIDLNISTMSPGGVAIDANDNLWYVDRKAGLFQCRGIRSCTLMASGFIDPYMIKFDQHGSYLYLSDTGYGIYRISGINAMRPLRVQPLIDVTPFAQFPMNAVPIGVAAGSAP